MSDRRFEFSNERVRAPWCDGPASADVRTPEEHVVTSSVLDLRVRPGGSRDRQVLYNDAVEVLEVHEGHAFLRARATGYVGYATAEALQPAPTEPTQDHWVASRLTHAYAEPDIKSTDRLMLSMGTQLSNLGSRDGLIETEAGWVPEGQVASRTEDDPAAVAERLIGTPYLWGGNSATGIDCSGLVWIAFALCGEILMPDSDLQRDHDGDEIEDETVLRGDLWFWDGHVAMVADEDRLIHANAHHMAVVHEGIEAVLSRIGPTIARKRISRQAG